MRVAGSDEPVLIDADGERQRGAASATSPTCARRSTCAARAIARRWTAQSRPAGERRRGARVRRRDRERRPRGAALRRRRQRPRAAARRRPDRTHAHSATARPATSAPRRSATSSRIAASRGVRNPIAAQGGIDPQPIVGGAALCAAGVPAPGARGHGRRLRDDDRARAARAARRRDASLDRQLVHDVHHRRPPRQRGDRRRTSKTSCARSSSAIGSPATTSRSMRRASCRSTSSCTSARRPGYFAADVEQRLLDVFSAGALAGGTPGSSIRTASPSASRCT